MIAVHRCLGWRTNGKKVHEEVRFKYDLHWTIWERSMEFEPYRFTDTACPDCKKAMEELYNKPIDELIDEAREIEIEQKGAKNGSQL